MASVSAVFDDVQVAIPMSIAQLPDDDAELAELVRSGYFGDEPREPRLPFADWIEIQGQVLRLKGSDTACWLAGKLDELASWARRLKADTPADFDARYWVEQEAMEARLRAEGYDACDRERQGQLALAWGHE